MLEGLFQEAKDREDFCRHRTSQHSAELWNPFLLQAGVPIAGVIETGAACSDTSYPSPGASAGLFPPLWIANAVFWQEKKLGAARSAAT